MGNTPIAESLIGVFVAMALVVTFRRKTHRVVELAVWTGLIWVCVAAVTGTRDLQARELTLATLWGAGQVVGTILDVFRQDAVRWLYATRFLIADWVVLLVGVDVLVLALVSTRRQAMAWVPVTTRLREWMLLPRPRAAQPARAASAVDDLNQRFNQWSAPVAAGMATWSTLFLIWLRDVEVPRAERRLADVAFPGAAATATWLTLLVIWFRDVQLHRAARRLKDLSLPAGARRPLAVGSAVGTDIVHINLLAERVAARKAGGVSTPRTRSRRSSATVQHPAAISENNGSEKHRQGRLAS
jgi:hypothetical protein